MHTARGGLDWPRSPRQVVRGLPGLVTAQSRDLAGSDDSAGLALRWETDGPGGELFPAWMLTSRSPRTASMRPGWPWPGCTGYRPGTRSGLGPAMTQRVARTMIGAVLDRNSHVITVPARAGERDDGIPGGDGPGRLPPPAHLAVRWRREAFSFGSVRRRIRPPGGLLAGEHVVADLADRLAQAAQALAIRCMAASCGRSAASCRLKPTWNNPMTTRSSSSWPGGPVLPRPRRGPARPGRRAAARR
jgi:hypothetical protein